MLPEYYEFCNSVKILSGKLALENLPAEFRSLCSRKPIVLTNDMLMDLGVAGIALKALRESEIDVTSCFTKIPADSSALVINEIAGIYRASGCDGILAIGGGSVIDTAKGLKMLISQESDDLFDLMGAEIMQKGKFVPLVIVPTTAGTGSEATLVAVIADPERKIKMEFTSYHMLPDAAVIDSRMTSSLPPRMSSAMGMDALSHAVEAYTCLQKNPMSDAYAISAIKLIFEYLPIVCENGKDETARLAMANASLMAGAAFSNSMVGLVHAIGHACGGAAKVPHADAMAVLMPHCIEYNMDKIGDLYAELLLFMKGAQFYASTPAEKRGEATLTAVREFCQRLAAHGLPTRLSQCGVTEDQLAEIAQKSIDDGAILYNPKEATFDDVTGILKRAL